MFFKCFCTGPNEKKIFRWFHIRGDFADTLQVIGNGSFGVVYQARLIDSQEMVAIKKVLQDKRFKVSL